MIVLSLLNACRRLAARPAHTALAVGILAVGLGAMLFLFGAVNGFVLRPLPFPNADRLVEVGWSQPGDQGELRSFSVEDWLQLRDGLGMFERIAIDGGIATVNLSRDNGVSRYNGALLDAGLLPLFGVQPLLGRGFSAEHDRPGAALTVLLSERVWRNDFAADPQIVGRPLRANGEAATIIGVLPDSFSYPQGQEVWIPRRLAAGDGLGVTVTALLAPGIELAQATQMLASLQQRVGAQLSDVQRDYQLAVQPLAYRFVNPVTRQMFWMMFAAGLLVLVLACVNVANLQLSQVLTRRRELAVRSALGAGRGRLLADLLAESLLLSLAATLIAFVVTHFGSLMLMESMIANENAPPFYVDFGYDWRDFLALPLAALLSTLLGGLIPALRASGINPQGALRDGDRGSSGGGFERLTRALVVMEIALTVVLLVGAAMFVRSIDGMLSADHGSEVAADHVLTGRVGLFTAQFPQPEDQLRFFERAVERLQQEPGVLAASASTGLPGFSGEGDDPVAALGQGKPSNGWLAADIARVDSGFAEVYGLRLLEGRMIEPRDRADTQPVVVIDRRIAQDLWPQQSALGQTLLLNPDDPQPRALQVIGVVDDLRLRRVDSRSRPALLLALSQSPVRFATLAVRLRGDARRFAPTLAAAVRGVDADTPVYWVRTQAEAIRLGRVGPVLLTQIFSAVGVLALLLAAAGLYGVLSFSIEQRRHEIGIRRAIGASARGVIGLVLRRIGSQLALGLLIGVLLGLPWSMLIANPALNTRAFDPLIFGSVIAMIVAVAAVAALAPLRRALGVDPLTVLRQS